MSRPRTIRVIDPMWWSRFPDDKPEWVTVDVDEYWREVDLWDVERLVLEMDEPFFWNVTLPFMGLTPEQECEFRNSFFTEPASKARRAAIFGLKGSRDIREANLLRATQALFRNILSDFPDLPAAKGVESASEREGTSLHRDSDGRVWDSEMIGREFAMLVSYGGKKALYRMAELLDEEPIGDRLDCVAWRGFCIFVRSNRGLPTIAEFQKSAGMDQSDADRPKGNKLRKSLGLVLQKRG